MKYALTYKEFAEKEKEIEGRFTEVSAAIGCFTDTIFLSLYKNLSNVF